MTDKQASVYIVDVGSSMGNCNNGRTESDFDWSMRYVWDKISSIAQAKRKTWCVGVVGLRTDETEDLRPYVDGDGYDNLAIFKDIGPVSLPDLKELKTKLVPGEQDTSGDAMSAIILANEMIDKHTKKNKWAREIFLITDGMGAIDENDVDSIAGRLNDTGVTLTVVGVDFDDPEYGCKEEDKPSQKAANERILRSLVDRCNDGRLATMAEAVEDRSRPSHKFTRLVKNYDGALTLGDPEKFPSAIIINVERWPVTKVSRPESATTVVERANHAATQSTMTLDDDDEMMDDGGAGFNAVRQNRAYKIEDKSAPGGKREVEFEELAKGYTYGSTAVHIAESEWTITKLDTEKDFSIIGFIGNEKVEPFLGLGETCVTVARPIDAKSKMALSALVHALYELEFCAVARFVQKDGKDPVILALRPSVEPDLVCLYDVQLPFAEDARLYRFPPLDKVVTITGKTLTEHRFLPDEKLKRAMSEFVDAMDISQFDTDEEGNPAEYAALDDLYSPIIHRVNQVIRARAVDETGSIEKIPPVLLKYAHPPEALVKKARTKIDALVKAADVKFKEEPVKGRGKRQNQPDHRPQSYLDVASLLEAGFASKKRKISKENSIPEFKQAIDRAKSDKEIEVAVSDLGQIIQTLITDSMGDSNYDRALENLGVMRHAMIEMEMPGLYNKFAESLKGKLTSEELGGDRRDFWFKIRSSGRLGLITEQQSEASEVTDEQAKAFRSS